jgi:hypothetical protein
MLEIIMNSLDPRHVVWLERGMVLGAALCDLKTLLIRAQQSWIRRSSSATTIE